MCGCGSSVLFQRILWRISSCVIEIISKFLQSKETGRFSDVVASDTVYVLGLCEVGFSARLA